MEETTQPLLTGDDPDETIIAPRFDEVEAVTAQPVVPFASAPGQGFASNFSRFAVPRRSLPLAVVIISALVGSVVGVAGLYFYQQRGTTDDTPQAETGRQAETGETAATARSVEIPQPTATPEVEDISLPPQQTQTAAPRVVTPAPAPAAAQRAVETSKRQQQQQDEDAKKASVLETRKTREKDERPAVAAVPVKRGKKGEHDAENAQFEQRPRRINSIVYSEKRREPRPRVERMQGRRAVDRVRGIFEGQPPQ